MGSRSVTKKDTLENLTTILARQAEALANTTGALPRDTVVGMAGELVNQLLFVVSPMAVEVEKRTAAATAGGKAGRLKKRQVRGELTKARLFEALDAHAAYRTENDWSPVAGWKSSVSARMGFADTRSLLRWLEKLPIPITDIEKYLQEKSR